MNVPPATDPLCPACGSPLEADCDRDIVSGRVFCRCPSCGDYKEVPTSLSSDLKEVLLWALVAAGITMVFGIVSDVLEALL
jgi:predicted amidophosphoribosyltransferase